MAERGDITQLLHDWKAGKQDALQELMPLVYPDLKRIAAGYLRREQPGHTLQATGLVHELYLKLCHQRQAGWEDRSHFYAFAAKVMRMLLTDHARRNLRDKRGGNQERVELHDQLPWVNLNTPEYIDLEAALDELEKIDPRKAQAMELCHILGCTSEEAAEIMHVSLATTERDLKFARGWLYRRRGRTQVWRMGDKSYWQRVEEIFHEALERPEEARTAFLAERCGGDRVLEREVREILTGYETQERLNSAQAPRPMKGARFGAFELVKPIGEGGMGAVYLARRVGDFEQRAAIKVIQGSPAAAVLMAERFRQERQILAAIEHPYIARVLDGGVTPDGQSYLAMEYVEGERLDRFCTAHRLGIPERLDLFRKICSAVHFAHQHLVVHRDLKPGNILVDEHGDPKLLDFGIAKVLDAPAAGTESLPTRTMAVMMTPEYASPEQIQGKPCTVASDVYSLGVILYELLAGARPHSDAVSVVTTEARRPSLAAPQALSPKLRGDLDGIVMKALARKPELRYGSAEQLSEDVRRHRTGLPVEAVEGTRLYVARKFVERHKVSVAAAAIAIFGLVAGLAGTLWQAHVAENERALAEQRFSDARKLANYLLFPLFDEVQPLAGSLPVRADMAEQSLQYLDRLAAAKSKDRMLRQELATGYLRLGTILWAPSGYGDSLGRSAQAIQVDRKALQLLEPLNKELPGNDVVESNLARANLQLGAALNVQSQPKEALFALQGSVAIFDRLAAKTKEAGRQLDAARAWETLMDVASSPGGGWTDVSTSDTVREAGDKAIERFQAVLSLAPTNRDALLGLVKCYITLEGLEAPSNPSQALATLTRARGVFEQLNSDVRASTVGLETEALLDSRQSWAQRRIGLDREALPAAQKAGEILDRLLAADPKNATNRERRASVYETLAIIHLKLKQWPDAKEDYLNAIRIHDALLAADPNRTSSRLIRATYLAFLARMAIAGGHPDEGAKDARDGISDLTYLADRPNATAQYMREASIALMVTPIPQLRDYTRALLYAKHADELSHGKEPTAIAYLAMAYANTGDSARALEAVERGLAIVPAPKHGEKPSEARQNLENEERDIKILIKTGKLPADFNQ